MISTCREFDVGFRGGLADRRDDVRVGGQPAGRDVVGPVLKMPGGLGQRDRAAGVLDVAEVEPVSEVRLGERAGEVKGLAARRRVDERGRGEERVFVAERRKVRTSSAPSSTVMACSATCTVTICPTWIPPRAIFWPTTMMMPALLARRCTVTGSVDGRGGGPAGRAPRSRPASAGRASRLRRCSRVVSISLRKLLARVPGCDVNVHTDGFPFDPKD